MLENFNLENILFLDIETVPFFPSLVEASPEIKELWEKKVAYLRKEENESSSNLYKTRAGIYAEFGKIVCISVGFIKTDKTGKRLFRMKSFASDNEKEILSGFNELLNKHFNAPHHRLCAHNGKEFDFPYICRRTLVNRLKLPGILDLFGKRPWEIRHLDTLDLWKFGDNKNFTSLRLLASLFNIPTPKDDIEGSDVGRVYWEEKDLARIAKYCQKDTLTVARLLLTYMGLETITDEEVFISEEVKKTAPTKEEKKSAEVLKKGEISSGAELKTGTKKKKAPAKKNKTVETTVIAEPVVHAEIPEKYPKKKSPSKKKAVK